MPHGTPRKCPVTFVPNDDRRDMPRVMYKALDHILRTSWSRGGVGQAVKDGLGDMLVYGTSMIAIEESDKTFVTAKRLDPLSWCLDAGSSVG